MIEQVGRLLDRQASRERQDALGDEDLCWRRYEANARDILVVMLEPSDRMAEAVQAALPGENACVWRTMLEGL